MESSSASTTAPQQSQPTIIPRRATPGSMKISPPSGTENTKRGYFSHDTFSPVNQNGSFEFDRVLKSGAVLKRTRKTKSWKPVHLVLRPNTLSIYKDNDCTKLRHQISLTDLTAVARQRDPKRKAKHVFGLFSPERNFHIEASNEKEAQEWVELIRREARIDQEELEDGTILLSPTLGKGAGSRAFFSSKAPTNVEATASEAQTAGSSSGSERETGIQIRKSRTNVASPETLHSATRRPSHGLQSYSGNEHGSYSDFSDTGFFPDSTLSLPTQETQQERERNAKAAAIYSPSSQQKPNVKRTTSQMSTAAEERVVYHGWLYLLKSKGGVRQWKSVWAVLRPKALALYKNEEEYSALLVLGFSTIIDAVDIDPVSKTKKFCLQVITEERNYRFCALSEEDVAKWLGALKSLLAKRKEADALREKERNEMDGLKVKEKELLAKGREKEIVGQGHSNSGTSKVKVGIGTVDNLSAR